MTSSDYGQILEHIFARHYLPGHREVLFAADEISTAAQALGFAVPETPGELDSAFCYRMVLPPGVTEKAPVGEQWIIEQFDQCKFRFVLVPELSITPNPAFARIKVPDATPGIVLRYARGDEAGLLAKLRYNRLIDIFTGLTCYSLQNHLRAVVPRFGWVETDEVYIGVDRRGAHYVIPVQGKSSSSAVRIGRNVVMCAAEFPGLICRPVAAQFIDERVIALVECVVENGAIYIREEKHFRLLSPTEIYDEEWEYDQRESGAGDS